MAIKACVSCGIEQDEEKFPSSGWVNGKQYRRRKCHRCYWLLEKQPRRQKKVEWLQDYKKTLSCENCGISDHRVLDFHHEYGDKEFNVCEGASHALSLSRIQEEIGKCQCLCANCHRILTYEERQRGKGLLVSRESGGLEAAGSTPAAPTV